MPLVVTGVDEPDQWADELLVTRVVDIVVMGLVLAHFGIGRKQQLA